MMVPRLWSIPFIMEHHNASCQSFHRVLIHEISLCAFHSLVKTLLPLERERHSKSSNQGAHIRLRAELLDMSDAGVKHGVVPHEFLRSDAFTSYLLIRDIGRWRLSRGNFGFWMSDATSLL